MTRLLRPLSLNHLVDRILDMTRTSINVTGDLTACVVLSRWLHLTDADVPD
ncbi:cation:dicarboxylate symporter family transporter [Elongatibacter sediminis]|uniref:Cation:dicarboxylase symporter family transporter n=1 Tax=Elongatibacter sediminis TaxID=3119006 RepID=A0AAW9RB43_9GAMM